VTDKPQITLKFDWTMLRPDMREYKQQSVEVLPHGLMIAVDIDLTNETVANSEAILKAQLGNGKAPTPVLTVAGMRQAMKAFESVLVNDVEKQMSEPVWDDADFDEDEPAETSNEDDWEDEVDTSDDDDDTPWEEDDEDDWS